MCLHIEEFIALPVAAESEPYPFIIGKACHINIDQEDSDNRFENVIHFER
jgi:hypothetical protein